MYYSMKGNIVEIDDNYIILQVNNISYCIYMSLEKELIAKEVLIYIHQIIKETDNKLFGFVSIELRNLFLDLTKIKGIGPSLVLELFKTYNYEDIIYIINSGNSLKLTKVKKLGPKIANLIFLNMKNKFIIKDKVIIEVLVDLGYEKSKVITLLNEITYVNDKDAISQLLKIMI